MTKTKARYGVYLVLLLLLVLLCAGCSTADKLTQTQAQKDEVYVFYGSNRTTSQWNDPYGVIARDGQLIFPLSDYRYTVIRDRETKEQLWIQAREIYVDDPALSAEELYQDNNWEHIRQHCYLYDLEGNLLQDLGERAVYTVYGDLVLYSDGKLERRSDGQVLFSDVSSLEAVGDYYAMDCSRNQKFRVIDKNQQVVWEHEGYVCSNGQQLIVQQNEKYGVRSGDGTEVFPCVYDDIRTTGQNNDYYILKQGNQLSVASAADGTILYTMDSTEDQDISYANDSSFVLQTQVSEDPFDWQRIDQMFDYAGNAISEQYRYIWVDTFLTQKMSYFEARLDESFVLLDEKGQVVFTGEKRDNLMLLDENSVIVHNYEKNSARLVDLTGQQKNKKAYTGMYPLYDYEERSGNGTKVSLCVAEYSFGQTQLKDLITADGTVLIEQAKSIAMLDTDRFWVEKGFVQGLMDAEGNWLYQQSLFDSSVDE